MSAPRAVAIVGAGLAGARAAEALREAGHDGRLLLVGEEPERPYERPPLSKGVLRGEEDEASAFVHDAAFYAGHDIDLRTHARVTALDTRERTLMLDGGEVVRWDRLLLATGAAPRPLPVPGADLDGVLTLRTMADMRALRGALGRAGRLVVIGAGWIGMEAAASARVLGHEVTVVERLDWPLQAVLGPGVGRILAGLHRDRGVELLLGAGVEAIEGAGRAERVRLAGGRVLDCAAVLVGVGVAPRTELAEAAGIPVRDGVLVDATLASGVPGVFAAGDVASALHPFTGGRVRVEHWANALNQGPAAARAMLGAGKPYDRLPYFFSDQFDLGMEYTGFGRPEHELVLRGDPAGRELVAFWLDGGRVTAGLTVNVWGLTDRVQALVRARVPVDRDRLRDPGVPLDDLLPAGAAGERS